MTLRSWLAFLLILQLVLAPAPAFAAEQDGSTARAERGRDVTTTQSAGTFNAAADPFTGAATLSFPIEVAPGTNGVQPSVVLGYSSSSRANGWVGKGWSLGFGAVEISGKGGIPRYDIFDTFTLNGEQLMFMQGDEPLRFRTRRENFAHIRVFAPSPQVNAPYWQVERPDGTVERYGLTPDSRIEVPGLGIAKWLMSEISDPYGNVVVFSYSTEDPGQRYPKEIRYTLRRPDGLAGALESIEGNPANDRVVRFTLEGRPDPRVSYAQKFEQRTNKRLAHIDVTVPSPSSPGGSQILRRYSLKYTKSWDNQASLLTSIEQRGLDPQGTPQVTSFEYTSNDPTRCDTPGAAPCGSLFAEDRSYSIDPAVSFTDKDQLDGGVRIADMNGDGRADLVRALIDVQNADVERANATYLNPRDGSHDFKRSDAYMLPVVRTRDGVVRRGVFSTTQRFSSSQLKLTTARSDGFMLADLTGDGRPDLLRSIDYFLEGQPGGCGYDSPREFYPAGGFSNPPINPLLGTNRGSPAFALDGLVVRAAQESKAANVGAGRGTSLLELDGDGLPDLVVAESFNELLGGERTFAAEASYKNLGNGTFKATSPAAVPTAGCTGTVCTDLNKTKVEVKARCTEILRQPRSIVQGGEPLGRRYFDLNGDGLDDLSTNVGGDNGEQVRLQMLNVGGRFSGNKDGGFDVPVLFDEFVTRNGVRTYADRGIRLIDINGDEILDIVQATDEGNVRHTWLGTQIDGNPYVEVTERFAVPGSMAFVLGDRKDRGVRDMDVDADGVADLVRLDNTPNGARAFFISRAVVPDLLARVTGPFGGTQTFEYLSSAQQGNPQLHRPVQTVSRMTMGGVGVPTNVMTFEYGGGLIDDPDREFRGFAEVIATNGIGVRTITRFNTSLLLQGQPRERVVEAFDDDDTRKKMQRETFTYRNQLEIDAGRQSLPFPVQLAEVTTRSFGDPLLDGYDPEQSLDTTTKMTYGDFGNVTSMTTTTEDSDNIEAPSERKQVFDYTAPSETRYLTNRVARVSIRKPNSEDSYEEVVNYYDGHSKPEDAPTQGKLTRTVRRALEEGGTDLVTDFVYDDFGNVTERAGPGRQMMTMTYREEELFTFASQIEIATDDDAVPLLTGVDYRGTLCALKFPAAAGLPHITADANANFTARCYDERGRPIVEVLPAPQGSPAPITYMSYTDFASARAPATVTTERVNDGPPRTNDQGMPVPGEEVRVKSTVSLDAFGRPFRTVADGPRGVQIATSMRRNALDQVVFMSLPDSASVPEDQRRAALTFEYDQLGRVKKTTALGGRESTTVQIRGITSVTDPNGNLRVSIADGFGDIRRVIEYPRGPSAAGASTDYSYDHAGRLMSIKPPPAVEDEPDVAETKIEYDSLGQRIMLSDPDLGILTSTYDAAGNLATEKNALHTTYFEYDRANRLIRSGTELDDDGKLIADHTLRYDEGEKERNGIGRLTSVRDDAGDHEFSYDELGRQTEKVHSIEGKRFRFTQTFDRLGALKSRSFPGRTDEAPIARIETAYDPQGFVTEIKETVSDTVLANRFAFDLRSRITSFTSQNGVTTTTTFDEATDLLEQITVAKGAMELEKLFYELDPGARIKRIEDELDDDRTRSFAYDRLNRLVESKGPWGPGNTDGTLSFAYDTYGNMTEKDGVRRTYGGTGVPPHAIAMLGDTPLRYDAAGNLTQIGNRSYEWNARGQLARVLDSGLVQASYLYDQAGRRARTTEGGRTRWFVTDDFEWDKSAKRATIYVTGPSGRLASFEHDFDPPAARAGLFAWLDQNIAATDALSILIPLPLLLLLAFSVASLSTRPRARTRRAWATATLAAFWLTLFAPAATYDALADTPAVTLTNLRHFHGDQLGSTTLQTDPSGSVVSRILYKPFGEPLLEMGALPPFAFTGQRFEPAVGLHDYGARFYDPKLGRFLSPDSIVTEPGNPQCLNLYSYVLNDPIRQVDPSGNGAMIILPLLVVGAGALINLAVDAASGDVNSGVDAGKSLTVGAVSATAGLATANPVAGAAIGAAAGSIADSALDGKLADPVDVATNAALGALGGKFGEKLGTGLGRLLSGKAAGTGSGSGVLFRGTTDGFPGNPGLQTLGITPTATDPLVATIFGIEARTTAGKEGSEAAGVLLLASRDSVPTSLGNVYRELETEVAVNLSPTDFAAVAQKFSLDEARGALEQIGFTLPQQVIGKDGIQAALEYYPRLTPSQIAQFTNILRR